jgi:hypothetical protein
VIAVTYPKLEKWNYWESAHINEWLQNPCDKAEHKTDHLYEIRGTVANSPPDCEVRIWIVVDKENTLWPQIGGKIADDGSWSGKVFLTTESEQGQFKAMHTIDISINVFKRDAERPIRAEILTITSRKR